MLGVHRTMATLQPVERVETMWLPPLIEDVLMSFRHDGPTVGLKGDLRCDERPEQIQFRVSDGVCIPRRRSTRLKLCAPALVTGEDGCRRSDVSPARRRTSAPTA